MKTKTAQETYNEISKLKSDQYWFLDIRDEDSYSFLHPKNAENSPSKLKTLSRFFEEENKSKPIYIICYRGNSSLLLQGLLESNGFTNAYSVEGGFAAWATEHLPVTVKGEAEYSLLEMELVSLASSGEQDKLSNLSHLETLGLMMAGAYHEISNPLMIIDLGLKKSVRDLYNAREAGNNMDLTSLMDGMDGRLLKLSEAVSRIEAITKVMRGMSYQSKPEDKKLIEMGEFVEEIQTIARILTSSPFEINVCSSIYEKNIYINKNHTIQILVNLIKNASDAVKNLNEKWINVCIFEEDEKLVLKVTDSGQRISDEMIQKIANPLFTTKEEGEGTGLGLSIVKQITQTYNGDLYIDVLCDNTSFVATINTSE